MIFFILLVYCTCSINVCSELSFSFKGTAMCTYMRKISNLVRKVMLLRSNCAVKLKVFDSSADATTSLTAMVSSLVQPWKPGVFHHVLGIYGGGLDH